MFSATTKTIWEKDKCNLNSKNLSNNSNNNILLLSLKCGNFLRNMRITNQLLRTLAGLNLKQKGKRFKKAIIQEHRICSLHHSNNSSNPKPSGLLKIVNCLDKVSTLTTLYSLLRVKNKNTATTRP